MILFVFAKFLVINLLVFRKKQVTLVDFDAFDGIF